MHTRAVSRSSATITSITLPSWPATSSTPRERLPAAGLGIGRWQQFLTVAGMVAVITAVLAGSAAGLLAAVASGHSLVAALVAGVVVAAAALTGLMRYQNSAWIRGSTASLWYPGAEAGPN